MSSKEPTKESICCRRCGCGQSRVTHSWPRVIRWTWQGLKREKTIIKRRRVCRYCGLPFTTIETYEAEDQPEHPENVDQDPPEEPKNGDNPFI